MAIGGTGSYLKTIGKIPLLSRQQEVELAKIIAGDNEKARERARKKMIESNVRLVISIAKRFQNRGCELDDLIAEGNIGLMRAVEKFDHTRGFRFSTYASWWIRQAVGRLVQSQGRQIKVPGRAISVANQIEKTRSEFVDEFGYEPSITDLSESIGVSESMITSTMGGTPYVISLDSMSFHGDDDSGSSIQDYYHDDGVMTPFECVHQGEMIDLVSKVLDELPERDAKILRMRFALVEDPSDHENFPITKHELSKLEERE